MLIGFYEDGLGVHNYNAASYFDAGQLVHTHRPDDARVRHAQGRVATLICNDAWQPHLVFLAVQDGARVLLVPTNSSQSRFPEQYDSRTYWRDITVFYARMFQCYVVFCDRVGAEGELLRFWGGSHIVDPGARSSAHCPTTPRRSSRPRSTSRRSASAAARSRSSARPGSGCSREASRLAEEGGDA